MVMLIERHAADGADPERNGFGRLVIGGDDNGMVIRPQQGAHGDINALLRAGEAQQLVGCDGLIGRRNLGAQRCCPKGLGIAEMQTVEALAIGQAGMTEQFAKRHALRVRRGQVMPRREFPFREIHFERKIPHGRCRALRDQAMTVCSIAPKIE